LDGVGDECASTPLLTLGSVLCDGDDVARGEEGSSNVGFSLSSDGSTDGNSEGSPDGK